MEHKLKIPNLKYLRLSYSIILFMPFLLPAQKIGNLDNSNGLLVNNHVQQKSVNGSMIDNYGQPLVDFTVLEKNPMLGTVSNGASEYQKSIPADAQTTILLVDDHHILYRSGTKRSLNQLSRYENNPVIPQTKPWELTIAYCSVHRDEKTGKYELWYQAAHENDNHLAYATSDDGRSWNKPSLGLIEFNGNKNNNLVMRIGYGGSVIFDPHEKDPSRRYKSAFWEQDKKPHGMSLAFSPDGIHWTKYENNPVIKGSYGALIQPPYENDEKTIDSQGKPLSTSDVVDLIWDPELNVYAVYSKTWLDGPDGTMHWKRAVVRTQSKDFIHWSKPQLVMATDEFDIHNQYHEVGRDKFGSGSNGVQLHSAPAFYYNGMYFSMLQIMNVVGTGNMPIELAISHDGFEWDRPFRNIYFLPPLYDRTKFDASAIWSNATPIILKDEIRFYYGAYSNPWDEFSPYENTVSGLGYATIPKDRFAGIKPLVDIGQITFKAIDFSNCKGISINADAAKGRIRVEILNEEGYRVRGFSKDDAIEITGDSLTHSVMWRSKNIGDLPAGKYRIRIHLENAEVFALTY